MAKYSSSAYSKIKLASSGKICLHEVHPEIAQLEEKKSQYEDLIKERDQFFRKKFSELCLD
jgi:flagellar motility protein MotE (MotC chaperone)